jgi:hypothetical protein
MAWIAAALTAAIDDRRNGNGASSSIAVSPKKNKVRGCAVPPRRVGGRYCTQSHGNRRARRSDVTLARPELLAYGTSSNDYDRSAKSHMDSRSNRQARGCPPIRNSEGGQQQGVPQKGARFPDVPTPAPEFTVWNWGGSDTTINNNSSKGGSGKNWNDGQQLGGGGAGFQQRLWDRRWTPRAVGDTEGAVGVDAAEATRPFIHEPMRHHRAAAGVSTLGTVPPRSPASAGRISGPASRNMSVQVQEAPTGRRARRRGPVDRTRQGSSYPGRRKAILQRNGVHRHCRERYGNRRSAAVPSLLMCPGRSTCRASIFVNVY